ncbi:MAG: phosphoribosylanthranilate isomerase [Bacteroidota bacterium]
MGTIKIKICCIQDVAEAEMAIDAGADALGLVGKMPAGPGPISDQQIHEIVNRLPTHIASFLLTSETTAGGIAVHQAFTNANTVQIVDYPEISEYKLLREHLKGVTIVQVVHMNHPQALEKIEAVSPWVDALLLDSGVFRDDLRQLGGTGKTHDWEKSRQVVANSSVPVWLAGGLNPENVEKALDQVRPQGVDICSGVRSGGRLDQEKLTDFVAAIRRWETKNGLA